MKICDVLWFELRCEQKKKSKVDSLPSYPSPPSATMVSTRQFKHQTLTRTQTLIVEFTSPSVVICGKYPRGKSLQQVL